MTTLNIPTTGLSEFVRVVARQHGVCYRKTPNDFLADVITNLSDDSVVTDEIEDLIVELKRSHVIDGSTMISLLGNYLDEKKYVKSKSARN